MGCEKTQEEKSRMNDPGLQDQHNKQYTRMRRHGIVIESSGKQW